MSDSISLDDLLNPSSQDTIAPQLEVEEPVEETPKKKKRDFSKVKRLLLWLLLLAVVGAASYYVWTKVLYPEAKEINTTTSGTVALREFEAALNNPGRDAFGEGSYLGMEFDFANGSEDQEAFIRHIMSYVSYTIPETELLDVSGGIVRDDSGAPIMHESELMNGETVELTYPDFSQLELNSAEVKAFAAENGYSTDEVDQAQVITNLFIKYLSTLDLPTTTIEWEPSFIEVSSGVFELSPNEDAALDKLLFSQPAMWDISDVFAKMLNPTIAENPEWAEQWESKTEEERSVLIQPSRFDPLFSVNRDWIGTYQMTVQAETLGEELQIPSGAGTADNPAGIGTSVTTVQFGTDKEGNEIKVPIKVTLTDVYYEKDAVDFLEALDERNRGIDLNSKVNYLGLRFTVENLSSEEVTIYDNSILSDYNANLLDRTGKQYGLTSEITLKPHEEGEITSWVSSTDLDSQFLIWGKDFARRQEVVWFDLLRTKECLPTECGPRGSQGVQDETGAYVEEGSQSSEETGDSE